MSRAAVTYVTYVTKVTYVAYVAYVAYVTYVTPTAEKLNRTQRDGVRLTMWADRSLHTVTPRSLPLLA
jgi:hypothetical protein